MKLWSDAPISQFEIAQAELGDGTKKGGEAGDMKMYQEKNKYLKTSRPRDI